MTEYDEYPYDGHPHAETHPDHVGAIAALFGVATARPERCRVLELGCGLGANLVAMADALRFSTFVGVDLSARQINMGKAYVEALDLRNVDLRTTDILDVEGSLGRFDYVICHGVYSWVPPRVQAHILWACRELLAPDGIAYVSLNTLPGWHLRGMVRDMLVREIGTGARAEDRIERARAFLSFLGHTPAEGSRAQAALAGEIELLAQVSDAYLLHEHLAEHNQPQYFGDFARDAARAGLAYVADAQLDLMNPERFGPEVQATMQRTARDVVDTEQFLDYLEVRFFRRSLFCHAGVRIQRELEGERLAELRLTSRFSPVSPSPDVSSDSRETFRTATGTELSTTNPRLKAALHALAAAGPGGLAFAELADQLRATKKEGRAALGNDLLALAVRGGLGIGRGPAPCAAAPSQRPATSALVRLQATERRGAATNLLHRRVAMDRLDWAMLRVMDGTRTQTDLARSVVADIEAGNVVIEVDGVPHGDFETVLEVVEQRLVSHARQALLLA
jgi:methyltransferase-like protein/ubiquinone/menaquinone biosynthesis C-methylase UbiE